MKKRQPTLSDEWLNDVWNVRDLDYGEAELENFDKLISSAVSRCLREDDCDRDRQAAHLSYVLGEEVSVSMLNAYSSEARRDQRIPASRFLALIAMTRRFDILDAVLRGVGGKALDWHASKVFRIGVDYVNNVNAARTLRESLSEVVAPDLQ